MWPDAYSAYGANLEAGLEGNIEAGGIEEGERAGEHYHRSRSGSADYYEDEWREGSRDWGRRSSRRQDTPSATLYVRVRGQSPCACGSFDVKQACTSQTAQPEQPCSLLQGVPDEAEEADFHMLLAGVFLAC